MSSTKVEDKSWILVKDLVMALIVYAASSTVNSMSSRGPWTCSRPWTRSISNFKSQDMDPDKYIQTLTNVSDCRASVKALTQHIGSWTRSSARSRPWLRPFSRTRPRCFGALVMIPVPSEKHNFRRIQWQPKRLTASTTILCSQRSFVCHKCSKRSSPSWHAHQDYQESLAPSQIHTTQFLWAEWLQHFSVEFLSLRIFGWLQQRFVKDLGDYSHSIHRYKLRH